LHTLTSLVKIEFSKQDRAEVKYRKEKKDDEKFVSKLGRGWQLIPPENRIVSCSRLLWLWTCWRSTCCIKNDIYPSIHPSFVRSWGIVSEYL